MPILTKNAIPKSEQNGIDNEIEDFIKSIPSVEKKLAQNEKKTADNTIPPVRSTVQSLKLNPTKSDAATIQPAANSSSKPLSDKSYNKSAKPKNYNEWAK